LITFLSSGASILTIAATAFLMNSRQTFYSLSFVDEFRKMGKKKLYMIHTMTDETYAVNCSMEPEEKDRKDIMFWVAFFSRCYWMTGAVAGGILGELIPFELEGIDFCMTALFVIIFIDQWEKNKTHLPAITGLVVSVICLRIFGQQHFMLPALIAASLILVFFRRNEVKTK
jgi:4-azaleucine resistance transporter AzlC